MLRAESARCVALCVAQCGADDATRWGAVEAIAQLLEDVVAALPADADGEARESALRG